MRFSKISYKKLTSKQQENYNYHKIASALAEYGFNLMRLSDDWQGADALACHVDGNTFLKIQIKGRWGLFQKYIGKDVYIAFMDQSTLYCYPHDELLKYLESKSKSYLLSKDWLENGKYTSERVTKELKTFLEPFTYS
ncbi:MAG: hypothetical protein ACK5T0_00675 [Vampirovibrionales bacterium]